MSAKAFGRGSTGLKLTTLLQSPCKVGRLISQQLPLQLRKHVQRLAQGQMVIPWDSEMLS